MLDLPRLERIRLSPRSVTQRIVAVLALMPNYDFFNRVPIVVTGKENIPDEPVIFAMNHTDRFNYFPFMYRLWREDDRFMSVWVKGKYYESAFVGTFMEKTNNLPTVSRGYIISKDFALTMKRPPSQDEYNTLRNLVDLDAAPDGDPKTVDVSDIPPELSTTARSILGVAFDPTVHTYAEAVNRTFQRMMARFVELNEETFRLGLDLLVFPQGTRSIRLSKGHIGMTQIALRYKKTIVPVGCNGSDKVHPSSSPFAKAGKIVYRVGTPIPYEELSAFHIDEDFHPFTAEAEHRHRDKFQGAVDVVMDRINHLLDPQYQFAGDLESQGVTGTDRFL